MNREIFIEIRNFINKLEFTDIEEIIFASVTYKTPSLNEMNTYKFREALHTIHTRMAKKELIPK